MRWSQQSYLPFPNSHLGDHGNEDGRQLGEIFLAGRFNADWLVGFLQQLQSKKEGRKEMFYLTTHSTHFIYGYIASHIWYRTIQIAREETRCRHMGYSFRLAVRVLLYAPSHRHIPQPLLHQSWSTGWNEK